MSLRDFLRILWVQKWVIVASLIVVVAGGSLYFARSVPIYSSTSTVRVNPAITGQTSSSASSIPTVVFGADVVTDPGVLKEIAAKAGVSVPTVAGSVSASSPTAGSVTLVTTAESPERAQILAAAGAAALVDKVNVEFAAASDQLQVDLNSTKNNIDALQKQYNASVGNQLLQAQLSLAVQRYQTIAGQIAAASTISQPAAIVADAGPGELTSASLFVVLTAAVLAGLVAGVGIGLLRFWLDGRIIAPQDVRAAVDYPVVGVLPKRKASSKDDFLVPLEAADGSASVEAFRALRTSTSALLLGSGRSVVVVTGVGNRVGTSTVATNLAASFARAGHSAVFASGDVRKQADESAVSAGQVATPDSAVAEGSQGPDPSAATKGGGAHAASAVNAADGVKSHHRLGMRHPRSPSSTIVDDATPDQALAEHDSLPRTEAAPSSNALPMSSTDRFDSPTGGDIANLRVLKSLVHPGEGTDALAGVGVQQVIERLREESELVVLDTPPVLAVSDALILAGYSDAVIVVAMSRRTRSRALARAVRRLEGANVTHIGIVINGAKRTDSA